MLIDKPSPQYIARIPAILRQKWRRVEQAEAKLAHYRTLPLDRNVKRCITLWEGRLRYTQKEIAELTEMQKQASSNQS